MVRGFGNFVLLCGDGLKKFIHYIINASGGSITMS